MTLHARRHLSQDAAFGELIRRHGRCALKPSRRSPYEALIRAIGHQQLHGRAAETILGRMVALSPDAAFPEPVALLGMADGVLRGCGFSGSKILAIRAVCAATLDGTVPSRRAAARLSDAVLIERLSAIRGIGRWTVEMMLISTLGRPDVLPVDDFGVREGFRLLYGLDAQPKPRAFAAIGQAWAPYRSYAAWYLWRRSDEGKAKPAAATARPPKGSAESGP